MKLMKTFVCYEHALHYMYQLRNIRPNLYVEVSPKGEYLVYDPDDV